MLLLVVVMKRQQRRRWGIEQHGTMWLETPVCVLSVQQRVLPVLLLVSCDLSQHNSSNS